MWSRILSIFLGTFSANRWRGCSQFWAKCTFSSTHARIWLVETFEFEAVDEGLVNFNHHFSKKLQMKSKDLNFLLNLRMRTLECKWFWRWLQIDTCVWTVSWFMHSPYRWYPWCAAARCPRPSWSSWSKCPLRKEHRTNYLSFRVNSDFGNVPMFGSYSPM